MESHLEKYVQLEKDIEALKAEQATLAEAIIAENNIPELNGSKTVNDGDYKIVFTQKLNRTIDGEELKKVAQEHGVSDALGVIFNWKPSLVAKEWKKVNDEYKAIFSQAFTEKFGKMSLKIIKKEGK